ncbi:MAG: hypothetical protein EBR82_46580, partial [Caulobacteraceae bacterium]|nr:hypothetical protein [Caulobacteraceae bacterium]
FNIYVLGEKLVWVPDGYFITHTEDADAISKDIENYIYSMANGPDWAVTPTGPFLSASLEDPYAVVAAAYGLYDEPGEVKIEGNAPTMRSMGLGPTNDTGTILY